MLRILATAALCILLAGCAQSGGSGLPVLASDSVTIAPGAHISFGVLALKGETTEWEWNSDALLYTDVSASGGSAPGMVDGNSKGSSGTYTVSGYSDHLAFTWGNRGSTPIHIEFEIRSEGRLEWSET